MNNEQGQTVAVGSSDSSALREHADKLAKLLAEVDWVYSFARQTAGDDVATKEKLTKQRSEAWMALAFYRADFSSPNIVHEPHREDGA